MNSLILAAGYATRLYPLTLKKAKPLLEVAGKPIIEWIVDQLIPILSLERIYIVTNHKFAADFAEWAKQYQRKKKSTELTVVDDGSTSDTDKLGAIGDIHFVLQKERIESMPLLVVAGDNLLSKPLTDFAEFAAQHPATLAVYDVKDLEQAKKYNQLRTNPAGILTDFEEKVQNPSSTLCGIALYYYQPQALKMLDKYIAEGNNPDQPGRFIQWLHKRLDVFTFPIQGIWYDIGSKETLEEANKLFAQRFQP
jgi:glucose-1-phosphate thymidylyltransferase